jgi:predicted nicotinamide N-methyase
MSSKEHRAPTDRQELQSLFTAIRERFETVRRVFPFGPHRIRMICIADPDALLDQISVEQYQQDECLPYWAELWPSALALARHVWQQAEVADQTVLELGCGLGLPGLVAAKKGGRVTLTDYEPDALLFARYHALLNDCGDIRCQLLDWRVPTLQETFSWILASDVLYEKQNVPLLFSCLQRFLQPEGRFVLADPHRPAAEGFFRLMAREGYRLQRTIQPVTMNKNLHMISIYEFSNPELTLG